MMRDMVQYIKRFGSWNTNAWTPQVTRPLLVVSERDAAH